MNIGNELDAQVPFSFERKGETVKGTIKESCLTPDFLEALGKFQSHPTEMARVFADSIGEWNLDYHGEPFPPTFDNLRRMPLAFYEDFMNGISEIFAGKSQTPSASGNGLAVAAQSKTATAD